METENQATDASGKPVEGTPAATPEPIPAPEPIAETAKVELKDGKVLVDGKAFVAESHLIASKKSLEGKLTQQQTAHDAAIDAAKLAESAAQQTIATLNAKLQENEEARKSGAVSDEDAASVKQELEASKASIAALTVDAARALELRRANLVLQYGVAADTIKDKNMTALDSFEEALKAVATVKGGVGNYATGGGSGEAAPQTPMDRAAKILESTPMRGVRNPTT